MKKIPTLFERKFENHRIVEVLPEVALDLEWVLNGEGRATVKWDGSCCAIIGSRFYKRYDAKQGKPVPENAIKCEDAPDPVTGHLPCWVPCDRDDPGDKWFWAAYDSASNLPDGTYEAIGPHFRTNPTSFPKIFSSLTDRMRLRSKEPSRVFEHTLPSTISRASYSGRTMSRNAKSNGLISACLGARRGADHSAPTNNHSLRAKYKPLESDGFRKGDAL